MRPALQQKYELHFGRFLHTNECFLLSLNVCTEPHIDEQHYSKEFPLNLCMNMNRFESIQKYRCSNKTFNKNFGIFHIILEDRTE